MLRKNGFTADQVIAILKDYHAAGLPESDIHLMEYAEKISQTPAVVTEADVELLRQDGLTDQQITDIALAVSARNFISRYFEAVGAGPDEELIAEEPELWSYLQTL